MDKFISFFENFHFIYPEWLLAFIPLVFVIPWLTEATKQTGLIAPHLNQLLSNNPQKNNPNYILPVSILGAAWLVTVIALAGPSWKKAEIPVVTLSGARVLVMDMSRSMYAVDIPPNRLTQARYKAMDLLPGWSEGSTGLVTYAADGYIVSPLTQDANTLANLIPNLSPEIMPYQGSNAAAGVSQAIDLLKQAGIHQGDIILITDGLSEHEKDETLAVLDDTQVRVSILAIGTQEGAPIELPQKGMLEQNGKPVIAKLDLSTLSPITKATGGILQVWQATDSDVNNIIAFTKKPINADSQKSEKEVQERLNEGFWLIIPLVLLALLGFRRGVVLAAVLVILPPTPSFAAAFKNDDQVGFEQFNAGDFEAAAQSFQSPDWRGIAQYKAGDYAGAIQTLSTQDNPISRYNLGNAYAQTGDLENAQSTYESLLKDYPDFEDAKKNLEIIKQAQAQSQDNSKQSPNRSDSDAQNQSSQNQDSDQTSEQKQSQQDAHSSDQNNQPGESQKQEQNTQQQNGEDQPSSTQSSNSGSEESKQNKTQDQTSSQVDPESKSSKNADSNQNPSSNEDEPSDHETGDKDSSKQSQSQSEENQQGKSSNFNEDGDHNEENNQDEKDAKAISRTSGETIDPSNPLNASHPVLKKLEQVPDNTADLIRAQLLLQSRQKETPKQTDNSW